MVPSFVTNGLKGLGRYGRSALSMSRSMLQSTAFRLTMSYMALFGLSVLVLLLFIYMTTAQSISHQTEDTISAEIDALYQHYDTEGLRGLIDSIAERTSSPNLSGGLYLLTDNQLRPIAGNLAFWPTEIPDAQGWLDFSLSNGSSISEDATIGRGRTFILSGNYHLLVGRDMRALEGFQALMLEAMGWAFAATALLGIGGGFVLTRQVLTRLENINRAAERIMGGDISHRVALTGSKDEFDRLAETLNAMLDQIEQLMAGIRTVTNNIAHDLRSPLTRMRSQLERAISSPASEDDLRDICAQVIGEADNLLATFNALLSIAEAEAGSTLTDIAPVDLRALIEDVVDLYGPVAEDMGLTLHTAQPANLPAPLWVGGNRELLFQALSNILDNAIKYTPNGGDVAVWLRANETGSVHLIVADSGPGIVPSDRGRVLERFVRLDTSRTTPGNGLGLSLVAAICRLHRASLLLGSVDESPIQDNLPADTTAPTHGLAVQMTFPSLKVTI